MNLSINLLLNHLERLKVKEVPVLKCSLPLYPTQRRWIASVRRRLSTLWDHRQV